MAKLVNFQLMEASDVICVWREGDDEHKPLYFEDGIGLDTAMGNYIVPRYVAIGTFDDGTTKAGGLTHLDEINENVGCEYDDENEWPEIFIFHQFLYVLDLSTAKAFVRGKLHGMECKDEAEAKADILADMKMAGIRLTDDAREYLEG